MFSDGGEMITWRGLGFLGFMIPLSLFGLSSVLFGYQSMPAMRFEMIVAAILVWVLGRRVNRVALEDGGEQPHQEFGFPMQWCALLVLAGFALTF